MTTKWVQDAVFYHIYPLGLCDAPAQNDLHTPPVPRLDVLHGWLDHIESLGINAVYLGPLFESSVHGYDTVDYFKVDRRLGTNETLKNLIAAMKARGLRVIFDAVFNHVGRDFWAFQDVIQHGQHSQYAGWFANLDFSQHSPYGDPFQYEGWAGHFDLVKLNLDHPDVRHHLFDAVRYWVDEFGIDGLRLDAADVMSPDFFRDLRRHCDTLKADFWLMGEVVHGDYRQWVKTDMLDATTNYECYKGLYSSHVDRNYFEIAYSLNRLFGDGGIYQGLMLYNFADNHDVNRVASNLTSPAHLYPLYGLLFTMPGVPSIYYGSEWGVLGERSAHSDHMLRPALHLNPQDYPQPDLAQTIRRFTNVRLQSPALQRGDYCQHYIAHEQFAFVRRTAEQTVIVVLNAAAESVSVPLQGIGGHHLRDLLNEGDHFPVEGGQVMVSVAPGWLRILEVC